MVVESTKRRSRAAPSVSVKAPHSAPAAAAGSALTPSRMVMAWIISSQAIRRTAIPPRKRPRSVISPAVVQPAISVPGSTWRAAASATSSLCWLDANRKPRRLWALPREAAAMRTAAAAAEEVLVRVE
jgi:hypothetical protein